MASYSVAQLEDTNGDLALILAKRLESAIQFALSGDVSGTSASTVLDGNVSITLTIGAKKVKNSHIDDDAVRAEHVKDGEMLPVDISGNAATATKATKDGDGNIIKNHYATKDELTNGYVPLSQKGVANGVATLGDDGKVPSTQLPSYVDDSIEGYLYNGNFYSDANHTILIAAESGKIYVDLSTNRCYRWSGSQYTEISASLALGETSSTAYRGDRGKTAYDHSQQTGNPHNTTLGNLGVTATASELNVLDGVTVNVTEINRLDGVTSNVQDQLDAKATPADIASAIATEVTNRNSAITTAIQSLDSNKTSTDGTNVQVKVTLADGKVTAVNITADNTASTAQLQAETNARVSAFDSLSGRVTTVETGKADANHAHGNITNDGKITADGVAIANNDTLVIVDASDSSKVKKTSVKFDGSTASKALTQKGTWEAFNNYTHPSYDAASASAVKVGRDSTGHVVIGSALAKGDVGLGNVNNTSDDEKKTNFTGSIAEGDSGFVTGDAVFNALNEKSDNQRVEEHELNCDNPHGVNLHQLNIPNLGRCVYDPDSHTLKMMDVSFSAKGSYIETDDPQVGDALYLDSNNKRKWLKGGDLLLGCATTGLTPVGVVIKRLGDDVLIHYFDCLQNLKFASAWIWQITGMVLDGQSHNIVFRQPKTDGSFVTIGTFSYAASTLSAFCTALDTWLRANPGGTSAGASWNYDWHCVYAENYQGDMSCLVIADNMADYRQYINIVSSGAAASANMAFMLPSIDGSVGFERVGGSHGVRCGANAARLIEYYSSNPGSTATLTSDVTPETGGVIVSKAQFEGTSADGEAHCAALRAAYKTFEEYIKKCVMLKWPSLNYGMATAFGKEKEWTYKLAQKINSITGLPERRTHVKKDGTVVATFPAADFAASINFNSSGLESGNWRMMGIEDSFEMICKMNAGLSGHTTTSSYDIVNKTLYAMKGNDNSTVKLTSARWLAVRSSNINAWIFANNGNFNNNNFNNALRVSAVALLTL